MDTASSPAHFPTAAFQTLLAMVQHMTPFDMVKAAQAVIAIEAFIVTLFDSKYESLPMLVYAPVYVGSVSCSFARHVCSQAVGSSPMPAALTCG